MSMRDEIYRLAVLYEDLHLQALNATDEEGKMIIDEDDGYTLDEIYEHLQNMKAIIAKREKMNLVNVVIEKIYKVIAIIMEKLFDVPMGDYFTELSTNVVDYSSVLADDPELGDIIQRWIPSLTQPHQRPGISTAILVFVIQITIGLIAAVGSKFASRYGMATVQETTMRRASNMSSTISRCMFKEGDLMSAMASVVFGDKPSKPARPRDVV